MAIDNLNLNQLRIFHAVAGLLSFTRASGKLNLTQPGISKHIKNLEEFYGARLFDRLGKKVVITQAGEILFKATRDIFKLIEESKVKVDDLRGLSIGKLNVGATIMIGTYMLPGIMGDFRHKHPDIEIAVDIALSHDIVDKVLSNTVEIGLIGHRADDKRLVVKQFKADHLLLIVSAKHKWAKSKSSVRLQELADQPFLLSKQGSGTRNILEDRIEKAGVILNKTIEFGNTEGVKKAVEENLGISIISEHAVAGELSARVIKSLPLRGIDLSRSLYVVYHKNKYLSEAVKAFLSLVPGFSH